MAYAYKAVFDTDLLKDQVSNTDYDGDLDWVSSGGKFDGAAGATGGYASGQHQANTVTLPSALDAFTVALWVQCESTGLNNNIVRFTDTAPTSSLLIERADDGVDKRLRITDGTSGGTVIAQSAADAQWGDGSTWLLVVFRQDASQWKAFVDGVDLPTASFDPVEINRVDIGDSHINFTFLVVWDRYLSDAEVSTLYNGGDGTLTIPRGEPIDNLAALGLGVPTASCASSATNSPPFFDAGTSPSTGASEFAGASANAPPAFDAGGSVTTGATSGDADGSTDVPVFGGSFSVGQGAGEFDAAAAASVDTVPATADLVASQEFSGSGSTALPAFAGAATPSLAAANIAVFDESADITMNASGALVVNAILGSVDARGTSQSDYDGRAVLSRPAEIDVAASLSGVTAFGAAELNVATDGLGIDAQADPPDYPATAALSLAPSMSGSAVWIVPDREATVAVEIVAGFWSTIDVNGTDDFFVRSKLYAVAATFAATADYEPPASAATGAPATAATDVAAAATEDDPVWTAGGDLDLPGLTFSYSDARYVPPLFSSASALPVPSAESSSSATFELPSFSATTAVAMVAVVCSGTTATHTPPHFDAEVASTADAAESSMNAASAHPESVGVALLDIPAVATTTITSSVAPAFDADSTPTIGALTCVAMAVTAPGDFDASAAMTTGTAETSSSSGFTFPIFGSTIEVVLTADITGSGTASSTRPGFDATISLTTVALDSASVGTTSSAGFSATATGATGAAVLDAGSSAVLPSNSASTVVEGRYPTFSAAASNDDPTFTSGVAVESVSPTLVAAVAYDSGAFTATIVVAGGSTNGSADAARTIPRCEASGSVASEPELSSVATYDSGVYAATVNVTAAIDVSAISGHLHLQAATVSLGVDSAVVAAASTASFGEEQGYCLVTGVGSVVVEQSLPNVVRVSADAVIDGVSVSSGRTSPDDAVLAERPCL